MSIWTEDQTLKFIQMYRDRPSLWNPSTMGYRDKQVRDEMFKQLSNGFGLEKGEIEKKLKGLQTQFARERRKEQNRMRGTEYKSKWFAYNSMLFLVDKRKPNKVKGKPFLSLPQISISVKKETDEEDSSNKNECSDVSVEDKPQIDVQQSSARKQLVKTAKTKTLPLKTRQIFRHNVKPISHLKTIANVNRNKRKFFNLKPSVIEKPKIVKDEYTFFGEQVAFRLRKIESPGARFVVQNLINRTLFEGELGMHNGPRVLCEQISMLGKCSHEASPVQVKSEVIDRI